jgi:hypothetical protein
MNPIGRQVQAKIVHVVNVEIPQVADAVAGHLCHTPL